MKTSSYDRRMGVALGPFDKWASPAFFIARQQPQGADRSQSRPGISSSLNSGRAGGLSFFGEKVTPGRLRAKTMFRTIRNLFLASVTLLRVMTTPRRYLAFDIETTKIVQDPADWRSQRPLGISCAATLRPDEEPLLWHGGSRQNPADRMTREETGELVRYLEEKTAQGYTLLTWNGLGFDLDVLAEESGMLEQCRMLATNHIDMMFHVLCRLGYGISLDAAAKGMGLAGKTKGMSGAQAPVLWAEGKREEVLRYVAQDVRTTLEAAQACESLGALRWVARSGKVRSMALREGWLTVSEALELPLPDTSWMDEPWSREDFVGWMEQDGQPCPGVPQRAVLGYESDAVV